MGALGARNEQEPDLREGRCLVALHGQGASLPVLRPALSPLPQRIAHPEDRFERANLMARTLIIGAMSAVAVRQVLALSARSPRCSDPSARRRTSYFATGRAGRVLLTRSRLPGVSSYSVGSYPRGNCRN